MRSGLKTPFWRAAYQSLPAGVRVRHLAAIQRAERWDLTLAAVAAGLSKTKSAAAGLFNLPAKPHSAH